MAKKKTLRPQTFDEHIGQDHIKEPAINVVRAAKLMNEPIGHTLLTGPAGCISWDTHVKYVVRYKDGRLRNKKGSSLQRLFKNFHSMDGVDFFIQSMDDSKRIFLNKIVNVIDSGHKEVFQVVTKSGKILGATSDHEFLTPTGDVPLSLLRAGSVVYINPGKTQTKGGKKCTYRREVMVKYHPKSSRKIVNGCAYYRLRVCRAVYEAFMNKMSYDEYITALNNWSKEKINTLWTIPNSLHVHHIDGNINNNHISNLCLLDNIKHGKEHSDASTRNVAIYAEEDTITSITALGVKQVYDIICTDPHRNFVAGGVVVHNCGKTSFASILARERGVGFVDVLAASISSINDLREILRTKLNVDGYVIDDPEPVEPEKIKPTVLFIDEIHRLKIQLREALYSVMEDRIYYDERKNPWSRRATPVKTWVPKFTLIAATTAEGLLEKPFLDRFENKWKVERYTDEQCEHFVRRAVDAFKVKVNIDPEAITNIARRARGTARIAIQLTNNVLKICLGMNSKLVKITSAHVDRAFEQLKIDAEGLTAIDYRILEYLNKNFRPCGLNSIASALEEARDSIENVYEPFLVAKGFVQRTPSGRVITEPGTEYLRKLGILPGNAMRYIREDEDAG